MNRCNDSDALIFSLSFLVVLLVVYWLFISPYVSVWHNEMQGKAELARAASNRQIAVTEAIAKKEAAVALADAEVIRASGVAKANEIIGSSLMDNEAYLRYLYIDQLADIKGKTIIYVPTEGCLPILESSRLKQ